MRQITVLLTDDNELIRTTLRSWFTAANFRVIEAVDGMNALELAIEHAGSIDVVVTDVRMPRKDGLELRRRLHQMYPEIPVIVISSYADEILQAYPECIVFSKPVNPNRLVSKIRKLVDAEGKQSATT